MNGLLIIDKPKGITSRDVVNTVCSILNTRKVGHAGTLDPIATGVLVVAVGNGLKILEFLNDDVKEYIATVKVGILTDTLDVTGKIVKEKNNYFLDSTKLSNIINSFKGKYLQEVPLYSSVKVDGKRLYKYARDGIDVTLPKREVEIIEIELLNISHDEFTFRALVSKGTYIRSLIRDIGEKLEIPCSMKELRRTKQGNFDITDTVTLEKIESGKVRPVPIEKALKGLIFVPCDDELERKIMNGAILDNYYAENIVGFKNKNNEVIAIYKVYDKDITKIKPLKVFKN